MVTVINTCVPGIACMYMNIYTQCLWGGRESFNSAHWWTISDVHPTLFTKQQTFGVTLLVPEQAMLIT